MYWRDLLGGGCGKSEPLRGAIRAPEGCNSGPRNVTPRYTGGRSSCKKPKSNDFKGDLPYTGNALARGFEGACTGHPWGPWEEWEGALVLGGRRRLMVER